MGSLRKRLQPSKPLEIAIPGQWHPSQGLSHLMAEAEKTMFIESILEKFQIYVDNMETDFWLDLRYIHCFLDPLSALTQILNQCYFKIIF